MHAEWRVTKIKVNLFNGRTNLQYLSIFDNRTLNLCYHNIVVLKLINSSDRIICGEEKKNFCRETKTKIPDIRDKSP